jgi:sulfide dehydrogenase cytochrome subunit
MKFTKTKILTTFLSLSLTMVVSAADFAKVTESCTACHGKDGVSTDTAIPSIGGMSAKYLSSTFKAYKDGQVDCPETAIRTGAQKDTKTDMCKIVTALSDDEIKKLVTFYSGKKFVRANQAFDAALAEKGKELHKTNCEKCHSENGSLAADDSSILAGQHKGYLSTTLKALHSGSRKRPIDKKMQAKFEAFEKDGNDTEALANYYASFK